MNTPEPLPEHFFQTALDLFSEDERAALKQRVTWRTVRGKNTPFVPCIIRGKDIQLKPEEVVRQLFAAQLLEKYHYPKTRIQFEYPIAFGREKKSADIVILDKDRADSVYMVVETKKPKLKDGKDQLKSYCHATGAPIAVWTNGSQISFYHRKDPNYFEDIPGIPTAREKLSDILTERWTIEDLRIKDKLVNERKSLKSLVLEMEDEVLANAGVDVFEELFKLIFTKLYDEMKSGRDPARHLQFRNYGDTDTELKEKIHGLFQQAKGVWEGVFEPDSKIELTASHLSICVASLQDVKLFNSNLEVVDEAFEYLISKSSKGEKGQYFTPRYVIDMCVKMLNPKAHETLIDTAAGSCGFPVHGIFHVWEQILKQNGQTKSHLFSAESKPAACTDYVNEKVFAIDFDEKAVRVARTLNLIAGDGQTNVLHLNTLDWPHWEHRTRDDQAWIDTYNNGWKKLRRLQREQGSYRHFDFDILMANPPFAGDIKQSALLSQYELGKNAKGKLQSKVGRDILFIERNLDFLKPGGRMAIVLPQGRFNNASDAHIRRWLAEHGRILAVVGLHGNVFKPHTGTKTSVLFFQKWHDTLCPKVDDYPIFFATMQKPGKDNSGEKIYLKNEDGSYRLDSHGHLVVDHDLFNHEGMNGDGIAEAFIEFAKKEKLSFFLSSCSGFDAQKYGALLERLEISVVSQGAVKNNNLDFRIDSEFFLKEFIRADSLVAQKKHKKLKDFKVSLLSFGAYSLNNFIEYKEEGIPFIRCVNMKNGKVDFSSMLYIDAQAHKILHKSEVKPETVLLSMSGSIGNVALASRKWKYPINSNQDIAKIHTNGNLNPYFLYAFLLGKFGQNYLKREARGSVQQHVFLSQIEKFEIPCFSSSFEEQIQKTIESTEDFFSAAEQNYATSQSLLLAELGLNNHQPSTDNIAVCNFKDSFGKAGRLDAEYYQPRYAQMVKTLQNYPGGCVKLGDCVKLIKGVEVGAEAYQENGIPFVRVSNLSPFGLSEEKTIDEALYQTLRHCQPEQHDILLSKDASPGIACYLPDPPQKMVVSGGVLRLKKTTQKLNHEALTLILNSILVKEQINRDAGGSVILHWRPDQIANTIIPVVPERLQETLKTQLAESRKLRQQSQTLLECAKIAVEIAVEQNETRALDFLESKV